MSDQQRFSQPSKKEQAIMFAVGIIFLVSSAAGLVIMSRDT